MNMLDVCGVNLVVLCVMEVVLCMCVLCLCISVSVLMVGMLV